MSGILAPEHETRCIAYMFVETRRPKSQTRNEQLMANKRQKIRAFQTCGRHCTEYEFLLKVIERYNIFEALKTFKYYFTIVSGSVLLDRASPAAGNTNIFTTISFGLLLLTYSVENQINDRNGIISLTQTANISTVNIKVPASRIFKYVAEIDYILLWDQNSYRLDWLIEDLSITQ